MTLSTVVYELFEYEAPSTTARELERQIRLHFSDAPTLYVSWTWERQQGPDAEPYSIAYGESSYFVDDAASVIDMSDSPLWSKHVGRHVVLAYRPSSTREGEYQVLEIRSGTECTFVYSLSLDRVQISDQSPI